MVKAEATPMKSGGVESCTIVITKTSGATNPTPAKALLLQEICSVDRRIAEKREIRTYKTRPSFTLVPLIAKPMTDTLKKMNPAQIGHLISDLLVTSSSKDPLHQPCTAVSSPAAVLTEGHQG
jgi:hypothetical protein